MQPDLDALAKRLITERLGRYTDSGIDVWKLAADATPKLRTVMDAWNPMWGSGPVFDGFCAKWADAILIECVEPTVHPPMFDTAFDRREITKLKKSLAPIEDWLRAIMTTLSTKPFTASLSLHKLVPPARGARRWELLVEVGHLGHVLCIELDGWQPTKCVLVT